MEQNFKSILIHSNNLRRIQLYDNTYNFIDKECNLLSKQNFKYVEDFQEGFAIVQLLDNTWNFIDIQGNLLSKQNFKRVYYFKECFARVKLSDDNWNFIDTKGNLLLKEQNFNYVHSFQNGFAIVQLLDNTWNFIDIQGNLLSKQNFKYVDDFQEGFAVVKLSNDTWYYIDKDLNFYDYKTQTPVPNPFNEKVLNNINELVNLNYSTINNIYLIQNPTPEDISSYQKSIIRFKQLYPNSNCNIKLDLINNTLELINFDTIDIFHFAYQLAIIQNIK